jgi:hypothetical protein
MNNYLDQIINTIEIDKENYEMIEFCYFLVKGRVDIVIDFEQVIINIVVCYNIFESFFCSVLYTFIYFLNNLIIYLNYINMDVIFIDKDVI